MCLAVRIQHILHAYNIQHILHVYNSMSLHKEAFSCEKAWLLEEHIFSQGQWRALWGSFTDEYSKIV